MAHESLLLPASVVVVFPRADGGVPSGEVASYTVALADLGLPTLPGVRGRTGFVRVLHDTALAYHQGGAAPDNDDELQSLAEQVATDYYLHLAARAEVALSGVQPWLCSGLDDVVEWDHGEDHIVTRSRPRPWYDGPDDLFHHGTHGTGAAPIYSSGTTYVGGALTVLDGSVTIAGSSTLQLGGPSGLLLEDGSAISLEDGSALLIDTGVTVLDSTLVVYAPTEILLEDGFAILLEDGATQITYEDAGSLTITGGGNVTLEVGLEVCGPLVHCAEDVAITVSRTLPRPDAPTVAITPDGPGHTIYGVAPPASLTTSQTFTLVNPGPDSITLAHESASASSTEAQFSFPHDANFVLVADAEVEFVFDTALQKWRPVGGIGLGALLPPGAIALVPEVSAPSTPPTGYTAVYAKSDGRVYSKDDAGTETALGSAATPASGIAGLTSVPTWRLANTITHADLTDADTSQDVTVCTLAAKTTLHGGQIRTKTVGSGGGVGALTLDILVDTTATGNAGNGMVANDLTGGFTGAPGTGTGMFARDWAATTAVALRATADVNVADLTGGEWEVYLLLGTLG